jgi:hypothetical protein
MDEQKSGSSSDTGRSRTPFNPNEHLTQLQTRDGLRDYLPVQWRLVWFREQCPEGSIETEMLHLDLDRETEEELLIWNNEKKQNEKVVKHAKGFVIFKAVVKDGKGGVGTGTKSEKAASFPDYIEKAETGAIGRALAALGYGTQFAPELDEEHRIVDSPVDRHAPATRGNGGKAATSTRPTVVTGNGKMVREGQSSPPAEIAPDAPATEQQLASIRRLCERLGKPVPDAAAITYADAKELIQHLSTEYNQGRKAS